MQFRGSENEIYFTNTLSSQYIHLSNISKQYLEVKRMDYKIFIIH